MNLCGKQVCLFNMKKRGTQAISKQTDRLGKTKTQFTRKRKSLPNLCKRTAMGAASTTAA